MGEKTPSYKKDQPEKQRLICFETFKKVAAFHAIWKLCYKRSKTNIKNIRIPYKESQI